VVEEVEQDVPQVDLGRNPGHVELTMLDEADDHQKQAIRAEAALVWVV